MYYRLVNIKIRGPFSLRKFLSSFHVLFGPLLYFSVFSGYWTVAHLMQDEFRYANPEEMILVLLLPIVIR
jgi:hypothetical protein